MNQKLERKNQLAYALNRKLQEAVENFARKHVGTDMEVVLGATPTDHFKFNPTLTDLINGR